MTLTAGAWAANAYGPKVDDRVAAAADAAAAKADNLNLIVSGSDPVRAVAAVKGTDVVVLGNTVSAQVQVRALSTLANDSRVSYVSADLPAYPTGTVDPASGPGIPYASADGAPAAWSAGFDGSGIGIAVLDSGVSSSGSTLTGRISQVPLYRGQNLNDDYGHGTFVANVAAGADPSGLFSGVAPGARIVSLKVAGSGGARTGDIIQALNWITGDSLKTGLNIRVIVIAANETSPTSYHGSLLDAAVEHAWRRGFTVVLASGNLGPGAQFFAPANDPFPIVVGALDDPASALTSFSSTGTTPDGFGRPDLVAPGRHIVSMLPSASVLASQAPSENLIAPGYGMGNGTSFAAPQVAGAAAILLEQDPTLTPDEIKGLLVGTARPVDGSSAPALDIGAAIDAAASPVPANQGIASGNCHNTAKDDPCNSNGAAYLNYFDWAQANASNAQAVNAAAQYNASATWNASTTWNASGTWNASASWNASGTWNASTTWNSLTAWN